jgi:hypothetical protein
MLGGWMAALATCRFTVLEEIPGLTHWEDMTGTLASDGYWPSFNVPYFDDIQKVRHVTSRWHTVSTLLPRPVG